MPVTGTCNRSCTTREHGFVKDGEVKVFDKIDSWDLEKYPRLKFFNQVDVLDGIDIFEGEDIGLFDGIDFAVSSDVGLSTPASIIG